MTRPTPPRYNTRMQRIDTQTMRDYFRVLVTSRSAQAALMTLRPRQSSSDDVENEHPNCEQWLFVVRGSGYALVGKQRVMLGRGSLLLIEKGEPHQVTCTGRSPLVTLNLYVPPAYSDSGDVRPSAK
jgi:mannose-6-phosphate isomerase-like protein (cupin superfamily)